MYQLVNDPSLKQQSSSSAKWIPFGSDIVGGNINGGFGSFLGTMIRREADCCWGAKGDPTPIALDGQVFGGGYTRVFEYDDNTEQDWIKTR